MMLRIFFCVFQFHLGLRSEFGSTFSDPAFSTLVSLSCSFKSYILRLFAHSQFSAPDRLYQHDICYFIYLLGLVALGAQRPIATKLTRGRSVGLCVGPCVDPSVCSVHFGKTGGSNPDAVWHHMSDGSIDEAGSGVWGPVHRKWYFWGRIWDAPL